MTINSSKETKEKEKEKDTGSSKRTKAARQYSIALGAWKKRKRLSATRAMC
jgi:hypothetical protein